MAKTKAKNLSNRELQRRAKIFFQEILELTKKPKKGRVRHGAKNTS